MEYPFPPVHLPEHRLDGTWPYIYIHISIYRDVYVYICIHELLQFSLLSLSRFSFVLLIPPVVLVPLLLIALLGLIAAAEKKAVRRPRTPKSIN